MPVIRFYVSICTVGYCLITMSHYWLFVKKFTILLFSICIVMSENTEDSRANVTSRWHNLTVP